MGDLVELVRRALFEDGLLGDGEEIIVALSGGADSVCLAHILLQLGERCGFRVSCAHFDHRLRGEESRRDADFVAEWCRARGVPLYIGSGDVAAHARAGNLGIEEAGRHLRYEFLESLGDERTRIATAHQAEDNAETVLLNLVRGSGLRGLGGIPPRRGRIIRPLLAATREDIIAYLTEQGLTWVEDSTNRDGKYRRNRLRGEVIPILREMNPAFSETVSRTARLLRRDEETLEELAAGAVRFVSGAAVYDAGAMRELAPALAARALRRGAGELGVNLNEAHVEALLALMSSDDPSASLDLPGGLTAARRYSRLVMGFPQTEGETPLPDTELPFGAWTELTRPGLRVYWGPIGAATKINGKFTTWFFKKERICGSICVSTRRPGDFLRPSGRPGKSLKKWLIDEKVPAGERAKLPVFRDEAGVLAVPGLGADVRAAVPPSEADAVLICGKEAMDGEDSF